MIIQNQEMVTDAAIAAMAGTPDARLRTVMAALVRHAHAFIREVQPTEDEFEYAMRFIVGLGQATNDKKNEVVLAMDVLGISTLVGLLNHPLTQGQTAAALLGPFWRANAPVCALGDNIARGGTPGLPLIVSGQVRDVAGKPVPGAKIDVWTASPVGLYENQDPAQPEMNLRGLFTADDEGRYHFRSVRPAGYPVPTDGPIGELLRAQTRHPYRPAHLHFMVTAPGYATLITQVFSDESEHLETDVTLSVIQSLVGQFVRHDSDTPDADGTFYTLTYDLILQPGETRIPVPPIP